MTTLRDSRGRDPWRNDTSRQCCDGRCNDNQGRGGCPRIPDSLPEDERMFLLKFGAWIVAGSLLLWAVLDPLGVLAMAERMLK